MVMNEANLKFKIYCENLTNGSNQDIEQSRAEYQLSRKEVTHIMLQDESFKWHKVIHKKRHMVAYRLEGKRE